MSPEVDSPRETPVEPERTRRGLRLLTDALNAFADATIDYPRLLDTVTRSIADAIGDACLVLLRSDDGRFLEPAAIYDADPEVVHGLRDLFGEPLSLDEPTMAREVMTSGTPICIPSLDIDEMALRSTPAATALHRRIGARGLLIVPLRVRGEPLGAISIIRHRADRADLDDFDEEIAHDLARHAALAIANARLLRTTQAELERRVAAEDSALFLDAIVENIPDMVFVKDAANLAFTRLNRAGEELLGIPRTELLGKSDRDFFPPAEAAFFQKKDRDTLHAGTLVDIPEEQIQTRHGQRWLHTKKVPIFGNANEALFLLGISHDITDRKRADAALRAAKEQTEAANRELEAFSYSVAHDLRAPLRSIDGYGQALLEDYGEKLDATGRHYLDRMRDASHRMAELIDDLLTLSRVTRAPIAREPVDLHTVARTCVARLERASPARRVNVVVQDGLGVVGDRGLLEVMLDNLLANAWKFTSKQDDARIEIGVSDDGTFFVRDDGAGFDMAYAHRLFGVFERLHTTAEFEGTGIGLATVKRIVTRHGGRIWAEGRVGHGATFHFTLPEKDQNA